MFSLGQNSSLKICHLVHPTRHHSIKFHPFFIILEPLPPPPYDHHPTNTAGNYDIPFMNISFKFYLRKPNPHILFSIVRHVQSSSKILTRRSETFELHSCQTVSQDCQRRQDVLCGISLLLTPCKKNFLIGLIRYFSM